MSETLDIETSGVLEWVNKVRRDKGLPGLMDLPKGVIGHCLLCPLGQATHTMIHKEFYEYGAGSEKKRHMLPEIVIRWIKAFDEGAYPQYHDEEAEDYFVEQ